MQRTKRIISMILVAVMCLGILPLMDFSANAAGGLEHFSERNTLRKDTFQDVTEADWFYENVKSVYELGLMVGKGERRFDPDGAITLAETITIAARLHAIYYTGEENFSSSTPWYQTYVDYARSADILTDDGADYQEPATRAAVAEILARALPASEFEKKNQVEDNAIPDVSVDDACGEAVYKLYRAGILTGNDKNGTFAPSSNIKRCEIAAIVTRMAVPSLRESITLKNSAASKDNGGSDFNPGFPGSPEDPDDGDEIPDYADLPLREDKSYEDLIALNDGQDPYIEMNDNDQIGLYIGKISDNKVEDVYDVIAELNNVRGLLNIEDARFEFVPCYEDGKIDDNSYRVQQVYNGVPVWCAQMIVIVDEEGYISGFTSYYQDSVKYSGIDTKYRISAEQAKAIAVEDAAAKYETVNANSEASLVIMPEAIKLIWYVPVTCDNTVYTYYVDALSGNIVGTIMQEPLIESYNVNASDISSLSDATYSFYGSTINLTQVKKTDNSEMFIFYDRSYYKKYLHNGNPNNFGVAVYNSVDTKGNQIKDFDADFPYQIIANSKNEWDPDHNVVHLSGLYALFNFQRVMNTYATLGTVVNSPVEVNVNMDLKNAAYCLMNKANTAVEFCFGKNGDRIRIDQLDTVGHEYTHMVQDYYVGVDSSGNKAWYDDGSLGAGYELAWNAREKDWIFMEQNSSNIDWVEAVGISEGTADIMGMLIEATNEGNINSKTGKIDDQDLFFKYGEKRNNKDETRNHSSSNTEGNQTVQEMLDFYDQVEIRMLQDWTLSDGSVLKKGSEQLFPWKRIREYGIPDSAYTVLKDYKNLKYTEGPGHNDGYIVVGILRHLVQNSDMTAQQLLKLWYTTITMLNAKSEFDSLRHTLVLADAKLNKGKYKDKIIAACADVGITYDRKSADFNAWFYKGVEKAYQNDIITKDQAENAVYDIISREEYLELLLSLCEANSISVDTKTDAVSWAKDLGVIGDAWTGKYVKQSIPRWQAALLLYQTVNYYVGKTGCFGNRGWKGIYSYEFVSANGQDYFEKFMNLGFSDKNLVPSGLNYSDFKQYYRNCNTVEAFKHQYMVSRSMSKTYMTEGQDADTNCALLYTGFYQLWRNGMFTGRRNSSNELKLGATDSFTFGEACALITQVIPD